MIAQTVGYAASARRCLTGSGRRRMLVREMVEAIGVPGPYLAKALHQLGRRGLAVTQRGIGGGVSLCAAVDPSIATRSLLLEMSSFAL